MRLIVILFSIGVLALTYYLCSSIIKKIKFFYHKHAYIRLVLSVILQLLVLAILLLQTYDIIAQEFGLPRTTILYRIMDYIFGISNK